MIIDVTGVELTPSNGGKDCMGNCMHTDKDGNFIDCCDECDYLQCCTDMKSYSRMLSAKFKI